MLSDIYYNFIGKSVSNTITYTSLTGIINCLLTSTTANVLNGSTVLNDASKLVINGNFNGNEYITGNITFNGEMTGTTITILFGGPGAYNHSSYSGRFNFTNLNISDVNANFDIFCYGGTITCTNSNVDLKLKSTSSNNGRFSIVNSGSYINLDINQYIVAVNCLWVYITQTSGNLIYKGFCSSFYLNQSGGNVYIEGITGVNERTRWGDLTGGKTYIKNTINLYSTCLFSGGAIKINGGYLKISDTELLSAYTSKNAMWIEKISGTLVLKNTDIVVANGKSPIKCTADTSASKDIYIFGNTKTNCDGTTYGIEIAFDESSFAPNTVIKEQLLESTSLTNIL